MIISITTLKGGTGKSTISQNLGVCFAEMGYRVVIVDTDLNGSSVHWSGLRPEESKSVPAFGLTTADALRKNIKELNTNYDVVIIDGTPSINRLVSTILLAGDIVLIPIRPSGLDIWATEKFLEKYEQAKTLKEGINAYFLLNMYDDRMSFNRESKEVLEEMGIPTLSTTIKNRIAYPEATASGLGVYEYSDSKAKKEMVELTKEILAKVTENEALTEKN